MKNIIIIGTLLLIAAVLALLLSQRHTQPTKTVTPSEAEQMILTDTSLIILDVRTAEEYQSETGHLKSALLVPVQHLEEQIDDLEPFKDRTFLTYSRSGEQSANAALILYNHGFKVVNIDGGIERWNDENLPVVKEPPRQ